ncbi:MAG: hypothetical protein C0467_09945 [Planctomycetaceae bacterium]|nr:hypothetical protein [Planctomycetaceae bacterium]
MALVVVRCLGCRGASRVARSVLGTAVECPRCSAAFQAIEEATLVIPGTGWVPPNPPPPKPWRGPAAPTELDDDFDDDEDDDEADDETESDEAVPAEPRRQPSEHDPHEMPSPIPASVFVGLSLLPFMIPIVWSVASVLIPQAPVLTVGTPLALAIATSVLCLAVISTIDWTPATRIKGVLLLLVLSYFTGVGLYFLRKDMVDRVRKFFGNAHPLQQDAPKDSGYRVLVPAPPSDSKAAPLTGVPLKCRQVTYRVIQGAYTFIYGSSPVPQAGAKPQNPAVGTDAWFDAVIADIEKQSGQQIREPETVKYDGQFAGREIAIKLQDGQVVRVIRVLVIKDRVYYLAVERMNLDVEDDLVREFFDSFEAR